MKTRIIELPQDKIEADERGNYRCPDCDWICRIENAWVSNDNINRVVKCVKCEKKFINRTPYSV